jgi:hypothetical protein
MSNKKVKIVFHDDKDEMLRNVISATVKGNALHVVRLDDDGSGEIVHQGFSLHFVIAWTVIGPGQQ